MLLKCMTEIILHQTDSNTNTPVEEISFENFRPIDAIRDWYGEAEKARAEKFLEASKAARENLRVKVFQVGKIRLESSAVGIDKDGRLMGSLPGQLRLDLLLWRHCSRRSFWSTLVGVHYRRPCSHPIGPCEARPKHLH